MKKIISQRWIGYFELDKETGSSDSCSVSEFIGCSITENILAY